jgi:ArsR family transcriptional regulator
MDTHREALASEQAEFHQIFSSSRRILILWLLESKEMSVSEIAEWINASIQNTSQHLRVMKNRGILDARRDGQTIYYSIKNDAVGDNCKKLLHAVNNRKIKK